MGLGNREVTPDALGPEGGKSSADYPAHDPGIRKSLCSSGRRKIRERHCARRDGPDGMETLEIVKGIVKQTEPDAVVVIDALAARSTRRLNRTIQITDAGIHPGSGVGNHRRGSAEKYWGFP